MLDPWLEQIADALGAAVGEPVALEDNEADELLELASFAAHRSGARTNAPLLCYLVGRASACGTLTVAELAELARSAAPPETEA
jgi:Domain of unknown function (DUF6457)